MQILENRIPFRPLQFVDQRIGLTGVALALQGPCLQQRADEISNWPANGALQRAARGGVFFLLQLVNADHEIGDAIVLSARNNWREFDCFLDFAARNRRKTKARSINSPLRGSACKAER